MYDLIRKLHRNLADFGVGTTLAKAARVVVRPLYWRSTYRIYGMDLATTTAPAADDGGFRYRLLTAGDDDALRQVEAMEEWLHGTLASRLAEGSLCLVALDGPTVAAFNLVRTGEADVPAIGRRLAFEEGEAWSQQITTHRDYRRRGLASKLRYRMMAELKQRGMRWFYGGALRSNTASLALARQVGFSELGDIVYTRFLTRKRWRFEGGIHADTGLSTRPFDRLGDMAGHQ